jgi:hypothetical protein
VYAYPPILSDGILVGHVGDSERFANDLTVAAAWSPDHDGPACCEAVAAHSWASFRAIPTGSLHREEHG